MNSLRRYWQGTSRAGASLLAFAAAAAIASAGLSAVPAARAADAAAGEQAQDFVLKSLGGSNLRLSEFRGRVVLLGFWASWCGECRAPLGELAELARAHADEGVEFLAVGLDGDRQRLAGAAEALDARLNVLHDAGGEVGRVYDVESLPYLVLIDRDGIVRGRFEGFGRGEQPYLEPLEQVLGEWPVLSTSGPGPELGAQR